MAKTMDRGTIRKDHVLGKGITLCANRIIGPEMRKKLIAQS